MPRHAKGPRLYLAPAGRGADGAALPARWVIRDGRRMRGTGLSIADAARADDPRLQRALKDYLAEIHDPAPGPRAPESIPIADVIHIYARDVVARMAEGPRRETARRLVRLADWWGERMLSAVAGPTCRAYAEGRPAQAARRELEDMRAAINHHRREGLCSEVVGVVLPDRAPPRERWLTRDEAARLIWHCWRYREVQKGHPTGRHSRRHLARFILVMLYTISRPGVVLSAAMGPTVGRGWVDVERGVFYRREPGQAETRKRAPPIPLPSRLHAHVRRWHRLGISRHSLIEWNGESIASVRKALANAARAVGLGHLRQHVFRHTGVTWAMQAGGDLWAIAGYAGMTVETLQRTYGHHHPDHMAAAREAIQSKPRAQQKPNRNPVNISTTPRATARKTP